MAEGTFDLVTGFNAFQFAFDPVQALTEARRVVVQGGRIAVLSWAEPQEMPAAWVLTALRDLLPPPPPGTPGPFALSEPAALRRAAEAAGVQVVGMTEVETAFRYPDLATALRGWNSSGVAAPAVEHAGDAAVTAAHQAALTPFLRADGKIHLPARFRILIGRR